MNEIMSAMERSKNIMLERDYYSANGFSFKIEPIFLMEETKFLTDIGNRFPLIQKEEDDSDLDLEHKRVSTLVSFFQPVNTKAVIEERKIEAETKPQKSWFGFSKKNEEKIVEDDTDYSAEYYKETTAYPLVKWLEKKVSNEGEYIRFYDLERLYGLNKVEIHELIEKFMEISNFPQLLHQKNNPNKPKV